MPSSPSLRRLVPVAAVLATTLALPTAASADVCASAGASVLGSGTDVGHCVPTPLPTATVSSSPGNPDLVQVRVSLTVPFPL
jgi:glycerol dehydrogenase-like iron-containing ADH family enzyme